ncbi:MAG: ROK family protein [Phycisphaerae bacterium]|jgi:glucokinase
MPNEFTVGLDLGGTNLKAGLLDASDRLVAQATIPTQRDGGYRHVLARLAEVTRELLRTAGIEKDRVYGVGLGCPGPMSSEKGIVYGAPNLPGWENVHPRDDLAALLGLPVVLDNDANLYALGEYTAGSGRALHSMVMLTLGTGIGGGIVIGGTPVRGHFGSAGEIGHMIVVPGGRPCPCGQTGCLERYSSAAAIGERLVEAVRGGDACSLDLAIRAGREVSSRDVATAAAAGDALAARIWDEACLFLALACVNIQHMLNVECVVLGGGLIGAGEQLRGPVETHFRRLTWRVVDDAPRIALATLGDAAGIIGAAAAARAALRARPAE